MGENRMNQIRHCRRIHTDVVFNAENLTRVRQTISQLRSPRYLRKLTVKSGILIPLCTVNGVPSLLYNLRSSKLRAHRGEVCFPGGRKDENETVQQTALRESWEEIGLDPNVVDA